MNVRLRSVVVGAAALAIAGGSLVGLAGSALAAAPGWEPDPVNEAGTLLLYDAAGNVLTGGNNLSHLADYAVAMGAKQDPGVTKATLFFAAPDHTKPDMSTWTTNGSVSASTTFPNAAAPNPIKGPGFTNPVVTLGATNANMTAWLGGVSQDTTAGYANIYQIRIAESGPGITNPTKFWAADVQVNIAAGTWTLVYPSVVTSTTTVTSVPTSPQTVGFGNAALTAHVTPATATGTVAFFDGATQVGTTQTVAGGTASVTATAPGLGTHPYTAVFTPDGAEAVTGSTSPALNFVVQPVAIGTTVALSANPTTAAQFSPVVLTANVTAADSSHPAGTVAFFNGGTNIGAGVADATPGEYVLTTSTLPASTGTPLVPLSITAVFSSTDPAYNGNTSPVVPVTITPSACKGSPDPSGLTCSDPQTIKVNVTAGSLTITTPYNPSNPFQLPDLQLNSAGTLLVSSAQFPKAGDPLIVVHSSLAGSPAWTVSVLATDLIGADASNSINGDNLGLTGGALFGAAFPGTVSFTDIPAGSGILPGVSSTAGLKGNGTPHTFAQSGPSGNGSASMFGVLSLNAPTNTRADTFTGTITFSVA
jgi:Bacterial Ig-like domain (group 3)